MAAEAAGANATVETHTDGRVRLTTVPPPTVQASWLTGTAPESATAASVASSERRPAAEAVRLVGVVGSLGHLTAIEREEGGRAGRPATPAAPGDIRWTPSLPRVDGRADLADDTLAQADLQRRADLFAAPLATSDAT